MSSIKTFRVNGQLQYSEIDDNFDNLNNDKIERVLSVNDNQAALNITQTGSGNSLVINTDDVVVTPSGKIGLGTITPSVALDINATDAINIPAGTTAQRPAIPQEGDFRFNKTTKSGEMFDGNFWVRLNRNLNVEKITSGGYNSIQIFGENEIYFACGTSSTWGAATNGRNSATYLTALGLNNFQKIIIPGSSKVIDAGFFGGYSCAYALCENGDMYVWGNNDSGQCGQGNTNPIIQPVLGDTNVVKVYSDTSNGGYGVGQTRTVFLKTDGYLYGAGYNAYGAFGLGTTTNVTTFTRLTNFGTDIKNVWNLGATYGCLIVQKTDNTVLIAGSNINGYFGNGTTAATGTGNPTNITSFWLPDNTYEIKYIGGAFGYYTTAATSTCSILIFAENSSGQQVIRTCGYNAHGQIGNGNTTSVTSPYNILLTKQVKQVSYIGALSTGYILNTDGTLYSWGYNGYGQVGNNTVSSVLSPTLVLTDVKSLPLDGFNTHTYGHYTTNFAVKNDGSLWAAGYGQYGQACNGFANTSNQTFTKCIIPVYSDNTIKMMGMYATSGTGTIFVAIREDNEIFGWGHNSHYGVSDGASNNNHLSAVNFKIKRV